MRRAFFPVAISFACAVGTNAEAEATRGWASSLCLTGGTFNSIGGTAERFGNINPLGLAFSLSCDRFVGALSLGTDAFAATKIAFDEGRKWERNLPVVVFLADLSAGGTVIRSRYIRCTAGAGMGFVSFTPRMEAFQEETAARNLIVPTISANFGADFLLMPISEEVDSQTRLFASTRVSFCQLLDSGNGLAGRALAVTLGIGFTAPFDWSATELDE